ncbi:hypothetical protein FA95DRAFT_1525237 [Auriscalpium vulgare]|uniref:Uncharacterized protein n=1 Tax=Auriscalpium vulgare TaxID=40419 RepID=A0ACB8RET9_9AGAM|nr:hypothetical protein FA95DRAFT_1525237 [Auriscalpium vulgare]
MDTELPAYDVEGKAEGFSHRSEQTRKMWSNYLNTSEKYDKELVENWKGDADGILIFTGLFSATVAAFIVESYKGLQPDSSQTAVILLAQLVALSNGTQVLPPPQAPFRASSSSVRVNVLWFLSLCMSLTCALGATLLQRWARSYLRSVQAPRRDRQAQAWFRTGAFEGMLRFRMPHVAEAINSLLHISLFLFFAGLVEFVSPLNRVVFVAVLAFIVAVALVYATLTVLPLVYHHCPYHTPLSPWLWRTVFPSGTFDKRAETASRTSNADIAPKTMVRMIAALQSNDDAEHFLEGVAAFLDIGGIGSAFISGNVDKLLDLVDKLLWQGLDIGLTHARHVQRTSVGTHILWHLSYSRPNVGSMFTTYPRFLYYANADRRLRKCWKELRLWRSEPEVVVVSSCILAAAATTHYHTDAEQMGFYGILIDLLDPPQHLRDHLDTEEDFHRNAHTINVVCLLTHCLPYLRSHGHLGKKTLHWVLDVLRMAPHIAQQRPSDPVCNAFLDIWDEIASLVAGQPVAAVPNVRPGLPAVTQRVQGQLTLVLEQLRPLHDFLRLEVVPKSSNASLANSELAEIPHVPSLGYQDQYTSAGEDRGT